MFILFYNKIGVLNVKGVKVFCYTFFKSVYICRGIVKQLILVIVVGQV